MNKLKTATSFKKEIYSFAWLHNGADYALEHASEDKEGCFYQYMNAIVLTAFFLEAYLNHLGNEIISDWKLIEKKLRPKEKVDVLCERLKISPNFGQRPYQTLNILIKIRNQLAHGKTELLSSIKENVNDLYNSSDIETQWQKKCNKKFAERAFQDMEEIVCKLHEAAGYAESPFMMMSSSIGTSVVV